METQDDIIEFTTREFRPLVDRLGFSEPVVSHEGSTTTIDFLAADIAVEIELDWREFEPFLMLVRLEEGELPSGYYVSNGRKCRVHLGAILRERGWASSARSGPQKQRTAEWMQASIAALKTDLLAHIDELVGLGSELFPLSQDLA